jgi:membrane protease YdiL (CAAX protease family)
MATITRLLERHAVMGFYGLVFAISWGGILFIIGGPGAIPGSGEQIENLTLPVLLALFAGPSTAGIVMTRVVSGRAGLHELLSRLLRWRLGARWYAAAVLFAPVLVTTVLLALALISPAFMPAIGAADDKATLVLFGIGWGLVGGGLLEELGWTGFAVPMLRRQYGALTTALVVGLLWGVWHILIALWMGGSLAGGQWTPYLLGILTFYLAALPAYRVLLVWVHDRTDSLLVVMLMHASLSASTLILQPPLVGKPFVHWNLALAAALCVVIAAIVVAGGWRVPPRPASADQPI